MMIMMTQYIRGETNYHNRDETLTHKHFQIEYGKVIKQKIGLFPR